MTRCGNCICSKRQCVTCELRDELAQARERIASLEADIIDRNRAMSEARAGWAAEAKRHEAARERIRVLEEALRPFAEADMSGLDPGDGIGFEWLGAPCGDELESTVADFRRAAEALKGKP